MLMVLRLLDINLNGLSTDGVFARSHDMVPSNGGDPFEVDLVIILLSRGFRERAEVILGEGNDQRGVLDRKTSTIAPSGERFAAKSVRLVHSSREVGAIHDDRN